MSQPPPPPARRDYRRAAIRATGWIVFLLLAWFAASWAWRQPFMATVRMGYELSRMPPPEALPMPVRGVPAGRVADTYGAPRGRDRQHQGVDIFAARGTEVLSTTPGIVTGVRDAGLGGRQVWIVGPARERHYYAHLDDWAEGLAEGQVVLPGDVLGYVGDTGNARGTPPHLHYGIYGNDGAYDPLPLLRAGARRADASDATGTTAP